MVLSKDLKIAICFGLIMGALLSLCNLCFAAEREELTPSIVSNRGVYNDTIISADGYNLYYIELEPGYTYYVKNNIDIDRIVALSNSLEIGTSVSTSTISGGSTISFVGSSRYLYLINGGTTLYVSFYREKMPGMTNFIDNIAYSLSIGELSSVWALVVPILAISVLLGLGFYLLKRLLNRIKRAKGGA